MTVKQRVSFRRYLRNCGYEKNEYCKDNICVNRKQKYNHSQKEDNTADLERTLSYLPPRPNTELVVLDRVSSSSIFPPSRLLKRSYESIIASDPELACFSPSPVRCSKPNSDYFAYNQDRKF